MELVRSLYNRTVRPYLPRKFEVYNGVAVKNIRLLDTNNEYPNCKKPLLAAIRSKVASTSDVIIVGGGLGVSSVVAAGQATSGNVTTYEAGQERYDIATETVRTAKVTDRVELRYALVGDDVNVVGDGVINKKVPPSSLLDCDVLVLDCEGAELSILEGLEISPETIIVETHEFLDSPESAVRKRLDEADYRVVDRGTEVEELGVYVLTAIRNGTDS